MGYACKIIKDSISPAEKRITTIQGTLPRCMLAELNTHRAFSRNSASSRAIPVEKIIERVMTDPFIPVYWGKNQKGMQASEELTPDEQKLAVIEWLRHRTDTVNTVKRLVGIRDVSWLDEHDQYQSHKLDVHKQIANRLLEPFLYHTVIITATEWDNFFEQRCHPDAQPEIRVFAEMIKAALNDSVPTPIDFNQWHLPYLQDDEVNLSIDQKKKICVARTARVSYLTQEGLRSLQADLGLYGRLTTGNHWSPFEHIATPAYNGEFTANFRGWRQFRRDAELLEQ